MSVGCGVHREVAELCWAINRLVCIGELEARDAFLCDDFEAAVTEYWLEKDLTPDAEFEIWWRFFQQTTPRIMRVVDTLQEGEG